MTKKQLFNSMYKKGVMVMLIGILSGAVVGVVVTFFALAAELLAERSWDIYEAIKANPAYIPLLFLVLAAGAFMVGTLTYLFPLLGANGVPQTEGVSRGILKMKWYQMLPAMAAASLASIFMGLSAGAEGPCMFIGGMCGDGVSGMLGCTDMERRYQITGGACAGVAIAGNAPLTGIVFALEEAHRRFTPSILICSFSAVVSALITRNLLYGALGLEITHSLHGFVLAAMPLKEYLFVALAALISGLVGVLLMTLVKLSTKLMSKISALKGIVKFLIPFLFAGAVGLITIYATGGGHSLISMLSTDGGAREMSLGSIFGSPIAVTLLIIIVLRLLLLVLGIGAGVPCGIFIPIIAIGALVGALTSRLLLIMGMDKIFVDSIVLISMATIFAATVKAPFTAIIFVVEFTWRSTLLLPVVLGVFIGYMLSEIFSLKPLYDLLLEQMVEKTSPHIVRHEFTISVEEGSSAAGQAIRDVLWQDGTLIRSIERDGVQLTPSSDTVLEAGDKLTLRADVDDATVFERSVEQIVKPQSHTAAHTLGHVRHELHESSAQLRDDIRKLGDIFRRETKSTEDAVSDARSLDSEAPDAYLPSPALDGDGKNIEQDSAPAEEKSADTDISAPTAPSDGGNKNE